MKTTKATRLRQESETRDKELAMNLVSTALAVDALASLLSEKRWRWPWEPLVDKAELQARVQKLAELSTNPYHKALNKDSHD